MDPSTFRKYGHEFIDWLADYFENISQYRVMPDVKPGEIYSQLPAKPPAKGEPMDEIFRDFRDKILPGMTHWQHPGWMAYFPGHNSPPSVLGELIAAGMGAQCMSWQTAPAATELEERVMDWLRQMIGLPDGFSGVIQDSASSSTLVALLTAREKASEFRANREGIRQRLRVYASTEAHSSIEKGVKISGYGRENLRIIPVDESFAMLPAALEQAVKEDLAANFVPACVIAATGSTSSVAMDPLEDIALICEKYNIWLHVDAAYAGTAAVVPEMRGFMKGAERADSLVFNPHKWMLTNFDCSVYFVKDPDILIKTFEIHPEYLKTAADHQVKNFRDWGIPLGRRFRALKLWFVIRSYGVEGIQSLVREHVRLAKLFASWLKEDARFEVLAPVQLGLVCFRLNSGVPDEDKLKQLNQRFLEKINSTGEIFITHTSLKARFALRMAIGARTTTEKHVARAWEIIQSAADDFH